MDRSPDYEILQFGHSVFGGDWAIVLDSEGHVQRVKMSRVNRVRTLHSVYDIEMNNVVRNMAKALSKVSL
jgi:hypothetical protein